ncbi:hypothetical protein LWI29_000302 [Acer saccharum]|uniref:Uncharacterized protein n=1 Tax=Acer saccharum TaxID=4024 RepID=A0AA39VWB2_ACESA|nr:hypothetical protein LWI29_000302 [Acer saccharum]
MYCPSYYLSLVAYYVFFNSSKVFYFLSLLVLASFYMITTVSESMGSFQELADGFSCNNDRKTATGSWMCLQFQDSPDFQFQSNSSFYEVPTVVSRLLPR